VRKVVDVEVLGVATSAIAKGTGLPNGITACAMPMGVAATAVGVELTPVSAMATPPPSVPTDTPTMTIVMRKFFMVSLLLFEFDNVLDLDPASCFYVLDLDPVSGELLLRPPSLGT
jgi:hypothetical protein